MINNKGMGKTHVDFSSIQFIFTYYPITTNIDTQNIHITVPYIMHATGILTGLGVKANANANSRDQLTVLKRFIFNAAARSISLPTPNIPVVHMNHHRSFSAVSFSVPL